MSQTRADMLAPAAASSAEQVAQRVRAFILENFYVSDEKALTPDASLIAGGVIDSTGVLEVIEFVEGEWGVKVEDVEMLPDNLDSIARIAAFVARKLGKGSARQG
jgi:acyl carrier protein